MAKKVKQEEILINAEDTLDKIKRYLNENKKISIVAGGFILIVILFFAARQFWFIPSNDKAVKRDIFTAELYFPKDAFNEAVNGDGQYKGFLSIVDEYDSSFPFYMHSPTAELAKYYAGISYLNMGEYRNAIQYLNQFSSEDIILSSLAKGCVGDAYWELGEIENAISAYKDAIDNSKNDFTTPRYMMKLARIYESNGNSKEALKLYSSIKRNFKDSYEASNIDKYIARVRK